MLRILKNTKSVKSKNDKVKVNYNSRDKFDSKNKVGINKVNNNKIDLIGF